MSKMIADYIFTGDISKWDVSSVRDMSYMFAESLFNGDISKWDVSKVKCAVHMFRNARFRGDISDWDLYDIGVTDYKGRKKDKKDKKSKSDSSLVVPNTNDLSCHVRRPNTPNTPPGEVYMGEMPSKDPEKKKLFWIERPYLLT